MTALGDARAAVGFLTRIPVGRIDGADDAALTRAGAWFPAVGVVVAAAGFGAWQLGAAGLGPLAGAVISVLVAVAVTGAIHEDGLADTTDGLWGGSTRERRLAIMRDSRVGVFGMLAVCGDVLLRVALIAPHDGLDVARILIAGQVIGRAAPLILAATTPSARTDGQGVRLGRLSGGGAGIAGVTVLAVAVLVAGPQAPVLLAAAALPVLALRRAARRRIGGVTGDVLGAAVLLTNLAVAIAVAALAREELLWAV